MLKQNIMNFQYGKLTPPENEYKFAPTLYTCVFCSYKTEFEGELILNIYGEKSCKQCMDETLQYEKENGYQITFKPIE